MTTYYVATGGSDAANGTTTGTPWATISKANSTAATGDTVLFNRGDTFSGTITSPGATMTYGAYGTGALPIINAGSTIAVAIGHNNCTVQYLDIRGWTQRGVHGTASNGLVVEYCYFTGGSGIGGTANHGVRVFANSGPKVTGVIVRHNTFGPIGAGSATSLQKTSVFFQAVLLNDCNGAILEYNDVNTTDTGGLRLETSGANNTGNIIRFNHIWGCRQGIANGGSDGTLIHGNHIHNGSGSGIAVFVASLDALLTYNHIHDLVHVGSLFNGIDTSANSTGSAYHNTIARVVRHCMVLAADNGGADAWTVKNNIFDASENTVFSTADPRRLPIGYRTGSTTDLVEDYNILVPHPADGYQAANLVGSYGADGGTLADLTAWRAQGLGAHSTDAPAQMTSLGRLLAGSPALLAAVPVAGVNDGQRLDIGAFPRTPSPQSNRYVSCGVIAGR